MAIFAHLNAKVVVNSIDLSAYCKSSTIKVGAAKLDATAFSSAGWEAAISGLKSWSLDLEFNDDFATSGANKTFWDVLSTGSAVAIAWKPVNTTTAATNPEFQGNVCAAFEMTAGGKVGDLATMSVSLTGTGAVTRAIA
jgi:predicted secreted protein